MSTTQVLRPIRPDDRDRVLALNEANVEVLSPLDAHRYDYLLDVAERADVIECDDQVAGFVVVMGQDSAYDSANLAWFNDTMPAPFGYLDRVALDPAFRRRGLAGAAYNELEAHFASTGREFLCLEVNIDPPNEPSLAFHTARRYQQVGVREEPGHAVAMFTKRLVQRMDG